MNLPNDEARTKDYSYQYDAYFYTDTGEWAEEKCNDPECEFCLYRPKVAPIGIEENAITK